MLKFLVKRILSALFTLFIVCTVTFFLMHMVPGGPFLNEKISDKMLAIIYEKYGLDRPLFEQYVEYMGDLAHGDLGISMKRQGFTVNQIIAEKFPVSAKLGGITLVWAVFSGILLGVAAGVYHNKLIDRIAMFVCTLGIAVPSFVVGTSLMYAFGVSLQILPTIGLNSPFHYIMPVIALSFQPMSYIARLMRSNMLDAIDQDYIKTARAKGLPSRVIIFKHAMKNTIIPVVAYLGPMTAGILTGGFVTERIFSVPGLGDYFVSSISNRDYPMIMGTTVFLAFLIIVANMIVDILYRVIDPRIKFN
jgi:oligopeptide transport system permease protein